MTLIWTLLAKKSYNKNIEFILELWNIKIAQDFILEVERTMNIIENNPNCFEKWESNPDFRKGFIHENVSFFSKLSQQKL